MRTSQFCICSVWEHRAAQPRTGFCRHCFNSGNPDKPGMVLINHLTAGWLTVHRALPHLDTCCLPLHILSPSQAQTCKTRVLSVPGTSVTGFLRGFRFTSLLFLSAARCGLVVLCRFSQRKANKNGSFRHCCGSGVV